MAYLGNPKNTIEVLQKYNFNFQKKFGQNFLIDTGILEEIIDSAGITKDDMILEIGPGIGTMTQYLCESARQVIAVEIDTNLIPILKDTLSEYDNVKVINDDILKVDINALAEEYNASQSKYKVWLAEENAGKGQKQPDIYLLEFSKLVNLEQQNKLLKFEIPETAILPEAFKSQNG